MLAEKDTRNPDFRLIFKLMRKDYLEKGIRPEQTRYKGKRAISGSEFIYMMLNENILDFSGAYIYDLKCLGANLEHINLMGTWMSNINIPHSSLSNADMRFARISGNMVHVDFSNSIIVDSRLTGDFSFANFFESNIAWSVIIGKMTNADMQHIHMMDSYIIESKDSERLKRLLIH